ncbi:hypothetical protein [Pseudobdellovibrio sp. HCB154]|uniref:hypothetical protein n=1 Tax=Pseudobdellovibrio sp. HCB154 TaxID=3386277 RepID=UPI0039171121
MQNKLVLTLSTVIVTASLFSCAPKDDKLLTGGNRSGSGDVQSLNIEKDNAEAARYLGVSLDRAFDGLALLKSVLNPEYAKLQNLSITTGKFEPDVLDMNTDSNLESELTGQFAGRINYAIEKLEKDQDGKVVTLVLKSENTKLETKHFKESSLKGPFISSNNMSDRIVISKGVRERSYVLTIEKTEELGLAKNTTAYSNTQIKLEFAWDGSSEMLNEAVKVTAVRVNARMHGARTGAITLKDVNPNLTVNLGSCLSANGELNVVRDGKTLKGQKPAEVKATLVKLEDSSLTIDNSSSKALDCASRPRIDLTRFLR